VNTTQVLQLMKNDERKLEQWIRICNGPQRAKGCLLSLEVLRSSRNSSWWMDCSNIMHQYVLQGTLRLLVLKEEHNSPIADYRQEKTVIVRV
jgi:hypothetical protein